MTPSTSEQLDPAAGPAAAKAKEQPAPAAPAAAVATPLRCPAVRLRVCCGRRSSDMAVAVAAIKALTGVIKNSTAQTMMGLEKELKDAAAALQR